MSFISNTTFISSPSGPLTTLSKITWYCIWYSTIAHGKGGTLYWLETHKSGHLECNDKILPYHNELYCTCHSYIPQITSFTGQTWGPPGSCRPQMGPMLALLSRTMNLKHGLSQCNVTYSMTMLNVNTHITLHASPSHVSYDVFFASILEKKI